MLGICLIETKKVKVKREVTYKHPVVQVVFNENADVWNMQTISISALWVVD